MDHAASSALACDPQGSGAVGARRVHVVINQGARRVTDPESHAYKPRRHFRLLFVTGRSRAQPFVEEPYARER